MGRVRNDILNGWKEIGGYVSRDIRTVERWEKQRGLPVRRVPGAGRATVYALIPELDEWLSRNHSAEEEAAGKPANGFLEEPKQPLPMQVTPVSTIGHAAILSSGLAQAEPGGAVSESRVDSSPSPIHLRSRLYAGLALAAVAVLVCAVAWPVIAHARLGDGAAKPPVREPDLRAPSTAMPYRSRVAGVDDLYLHGIYFYEQRTPDALRHSLQDFSGAIAKDPNYAPAYAGLANTYNLLREYSGMSDAEAYPRAKAAAERAIALDPSLPQAHASLGFIDFFWSWDAESAEREFRRALALDSNCVIAHHWFGSMLTHEGRYAEAIEQLDIAQRLEPTSAAILSTRALAFGLNGHRDEAADMLQEVLKGAPSATSPHNVLMTLSLIEPRNIPRYLQQAQKIAELRGDNELLQVMDAAKTAYATSGEKAMWAAILSAEQRFHPSPGDRTYAMAQAESALGMKEAALDDLEQIHRRREPRLIGMLNDPMMRPLRDEPRFRQILGGMGLPMSRP